MKTNKLIDHTYLKAVGTAHEIDAIIDEAKRYDFKSVCVNPTWVQKAKRALKDTDVLVCTVVGFPLGANTTETKVFEAKDALTKGADEIDMVLNIGAAKAHDYGFITDEVNAVKEACGDHTLKVILETCYLTDEEIKEAGKAAIDGGADFIKTSTGFGTGGATVKHVKIMKSVAKDKEVKASGGVRSLEDLNNMVDAGATRIGASSGVKIMEGKQSEEAY
ncbi:MAG: deoxyribose-phosphate aldolase [Candidatus Izemoplasma sp.]|nr:deoxyribose-phosphate aldolase [Candidatus Izemoplasma sp.]